MPSPLINTREDLDAIQGTPQHAEFLRYLVGTLTTKTDVAVRPEGYGQPGYTGPVIEALWQEVDNPTAATRFGYTPDEVRALVRG